eukprot:1184993-Prorocentrum_minimum.AAC.1
MKRPGVSDDAGADDPTQSRAGGGAGADARWRRSGRSRGRRRSSQRPQPITLAALRASRPL